ncbi:HPr-rel-A system PqqD family peptide chaperone, partial [Sphingosinicella sp.]|uniref:HPr-rel-A system PqqD family peptide chaperone n=1 Tax=Sphingosinicella sp. TaxID=1917971 RepID=UPI0040383C91
GRSRPLRVPDTDPRAPAMAGPRYIADPGADVRIVALDGLSVLYHAPSGMTHIVASPAPEILVALQAGPADAAELLARLAAAYDLGATNAAEIVSLRLTELEQAGLVRRDEVSLREPQDGSTRRAA